jgi:hypothetical protein
MTLVKSLSEAHPGFGFASGPVEVHRYVDGRVQVADVDGEGTIAVGSAVGGTGVVAVGGTGVVAGSSAEAPDRNCLMGCTR